MVKNVFVLYKLSDDRGESRWVENLPASDILADATTISSRVLIPKWRENSKQDY